MARTLWEIEDVQDEAYKAERDFDKAIQEKIKVHNEEVAKEKSKGFKFRLFNISDNKKLYKNFCWACSRGLKCPKHPDPDLQRKDEPLRNEEQFVGNENTHIVKR